ncbi:autophagy-related protein 23-like [Phoenix dactylifera]|uniref:Autophagy-related protein 23-like n=1 Tax=Phoenix dactylifera TaxID=42345 RepID=A0A8B7D4Z5_PHODC|nr:autophagy-related protein 23-like [Phoenix dactylifera]XP_017702322.2 autophagy-related protein 23-like [Phoenix dactylifera]
MDGKKKKNRKKKGSQSKITEDATASAEAVSVQEHNNSSATEQNHHAQNSGNADVQSTGVSESDIELENRKIYEENYVKLQEEIRQLADEKNSWLQKQVNLEEKIKVLQNEVECCSQKEASLEAKLNDLRIGNDSVIQKEVILEDRVKDIEGIKDIWALKETSIREMIARLEEANITVQMQVRELEESRSNILQENQHLVENISGLELRIQRLEREASFYATSKMEMTKFPEEIKSLDQIEAVDALMQKPDSGNEELAGKVTEQHMQPNQHAASAEHSSPVLNHEMTQTGTSTDYVSQYGEQIQPSVGIQGRSSTSNGVEDSVADPGVRSAQPPGLDEPRISEDIVSVPLDEIQIHEEDLQGRKNIEKPAEVPLSDAPLIGAPFRLISFVAKYVSGADLAK